MIQVIFTFFSSFSEADGETPRMSYSLVSTTLAMMLTGYTERPSAEVRLREEPTQDSPAGTVQGCQILRQTQTPTRKQMPKSATLFFQNSYTVYVFNVMLDIS